MEYTILMPCLNEWEGLAFCIREAQGYIEAHGLDAEILIADNGSTDGSPQLAERCGARVVQVAERGYGAALLGGIKAAKGRYIIMGDADGSYDFSNLTPFLEGLAAGYQLVMGNRFSGGIEKGAMPLSHHIGVRVLSALARWRCGAPVGDFHCGLRAFEREAALALELRCPGMEFATEIIAAFAKSGARICEVPAPLRRDKRKARSHLRPIRDGCRHLQYIWSLRR